MTLEITLERTLVVDDEDLRLLSIPLSPEDFVVDDVVVSSSSEEVDVDVDDFSFESVDVTDVADVTPCTLAKGRSVLSLLDVTQRGIAATATQIEIITFFFMWIEVFLMQR